MATGKDKSIMEHSESSFTVLVSLHYVLVAAIIENALKWKKLLIAQFSTKLNKFFIKCLEYVDTKSTIIYTHCFLLKMIKCYLLSRKKNLIFFIKFKLEILQK